MKSRLKYDEIKEKYHDKFRIYPHLEPDDDCIEIRFNDENDNEFYFYVYGKWHPRKREIEYDLEEFEDELNEALLKIKQKRLKKKLRKIKKDFK